jgi:hypothetical protein
VRYSATELAHVFAPHFDLVDTRSEEHLTPAGLVQPFTWVVLSPSRPREEVRTLPDPE